MKYRKKPVVIDAICFHDGGLYPEVMRFCHPHKIQMQNDGDLNFRLIIPTLEGDMICNQGDYIIKGVKGEFYPCKPDIFEMTYEAVVP